MKLEVKRGKVTIFACLFFLILTFLPFVLLSFYNTPLADDFTYAFRLLDKGLFESQTFWYRNWTGRYLATLLISTNPVYLKWETGVIIIPIAIISTFAVSLYYFITSFGVLKLTSSKIIVFTLVLMVYFSNLATISEAFYWIASTYTYTFGTILFLFCWGYIIRVYRGTYRAKFISYLFILLLVAALTGTNELLIFYHVYISFLLFLYVFLKDKNKLVLVSVVLIFSVGFALLSLLAPGNFVRQKAIGEESVSLFKIVYQTIYVALRVWLPHYIFNIPFILALVSFLYFLGKERWNGIADMRLKIHPIYLFVLLLGGYVFTYLPQTLAHTSEARAYNFSYFTFLLAVIISLVYSAVYYDINQYASKIRNGSVLSNLSLIFVLAVILIFPKSNIIQAYKDVYSKDAKCYFDELTFRHKFLSQNQGKRLVYISPLTCHPKSLFHVDVSPQVKHWTNSGYELYFRIDTVLASK
jgi:hypothetical protein